MSERGCVQRGLAVSCQHRLTSITLLSLGGANVPALNDLLSPWGIALSDEVLEGEFSLADHKVHFASGSSIARFPEDGFLITRDLNNQGG